MGQKQMYRILMKRTLWTAVLLLLAVTLSCRGETALTGTVRMEAAAEQPLELSFMVMNWGKMADNYVPEALKLLESRTNTLLTPMWIQATEYLARLNVVLASGDPPDLVQMRPEITAQKYTSNQIKSFTDGMFHDLTPYIRDPLFAEKYPNLGAYPQPIWDNISIEGRIYGIPSHISPKSFDGIFIRKDLLDRAGLNVPVTTDELAEVIIRLSHPPERYGLEISEASVIDSSGLKSLAVAFTGVMDWKADEAGNFTHQVFMPEYKEFLEWLAKLYKAGAIHPEFALAQKAAEYRAGTAAVTLFRWHAYFPSRNVPVPLNPDISDEAESLLIKPVRGPVTWSVEMNSGYWTSTSISSKVAEADIPRVLQFLDYLASPEYEDLFWYGLEGVHYEVMDGYKTTNDRYEEDGVGMLGWFSHENRDFIEDARKRGATEENLVYLQEIVDDIYLKYEEARLQNPQYSTYSATYFARWEQLVEELDDYRVKVIMGILSLDEWDAYVKSLTESSIFKSILQELKQSYLDQAVQR